MSDELFSLAPSLPRWKEIRNENNIVVNYKPGATPGEEWAAYDFSVIEMSAEDIAASDPLDLIQEFEELMEEEQAIGYGETERIAVIAVIHQRQLPGWDELSMP